MTKLILTFLFLFGLFSEDSISSLSKEFVMMLDDNGSEITILMELEDDAGKVTIKEGDEEYVYDVQDFEGNPEQTITLSSGKQLTIRFEDDDFHLDLDGDEILGSTNTEKTIIIRGGGKSKCRVLTIKNDHEGADEECDHVAVHVLAHEDMEDMLDEEKIDVLLEELGDIEGLMTIDVDVEEEEDGQRRVIKIIKEKK